MNQPDLIIAELLLAIALLQQREELNDVRIVVIKLVAGAIETKDQRALFPALLCAGRDHWALVIGIKTKLPLQFRFLTFLVVVVCS